MNKWTRPRRLLTLSFLLLLAFQMTPQGAVHIVRASPNVSQIYLTPTATCCKLNQTSFTVRVMLNLTAGDAINVIDVRLDYSGFWSVYTNRTGIIQAQSIDYSGNIFGSSGDLLFECMDAVQYLGRPCSSDDASAGQVHFAQGGNTINGPLNGQFLFSVAFGVHNNGTSIFTFDRSDLVNPSPDPSNPLLLNAHSIKVVRYDAIFANKGLGTFFNYAPSSPPAILPGRTVLFDAGMSFNATASSSLVNPRFSWNFGDGTPPLITQTSPNANHIFQTPGTYHVQLNVTEANGGVGTITRLVTVVPALGTISLIVRNALGSAIIGGIQVQLFNSTSSASPFQNKTITGAGQANFTSLAPSNYLLKFSGAGYQNSSKAETVEPGVTTVDNIYLLSVPPPSQNLNGLVILVGVVTGGLVLGSLAFVLKRRRSATHGRVSRPKS